MHARVEHRQQGIKDGGLDTGAPARHLVQPGEHDRSHDVDRELGRDPGRVAEQDVALEKRLVGWVEALVLELADVRRQAVDRVIARGQLLDDGPGLLEGAARILAQRHRCAAARHPSDLLDRQIPAGDDHGRRPGGALKHAAQPVTDQEHVGVERRARHAGGEELPSGTGRFTLAHDHRYGSVEPRGERGVEVELREQLGVGNLEQSGLHRGAGAVEGCVTTEQADAADDVAGLEALAVPVAVAQVELPLQHQHQGPDWLPVAEEKPAGRNRRAAPMVDEPVHVVLAQRAEYVGPDAAGAASSLHIARAGQGFSHPGGR